MKIAIYENSFSLRQLSTSAAGAPLFEIFLTLDGKGNYKKQVLFPSLILSSYCPVLVVVIFVGESFRR